MYARSEDGSGRRSSPSGRPQLRLARSRRALSSRLSTVAHRANTTTLHNPRQASSKTISEVLNCIALFLAPNVAESRDDRILIDSQRAGDPAADGLCVHLAHPALSRLRLTFMSGEPCTRVATRLRSRFSTSSSGVIMRCGGELVKSRVRPSVAERNSYAREYDGASSSSFAEGDSYA